SGEWGSLPLEGGIEAAYKAQLEAAEDPDALRAEIAERLARARDPFKTAEVFLVEDIVDPRETRPRLCEFANLAAPRRDRGGAPTRRSRCPSPSTPSSSTWTGRAAATPTSPRSPPPTASSTAAGSGTTVTSVPTRTRSSRRTRCAARRSRRTWRASASTSGG